MIDFLEEEVSISVGNENSHIEYFYGCSMFEVLANFHDAIINFVHDWNHPKMLMWGVHCSQWYAWAISSYPRPSQSYEAMEQLGQAFYDEFEGMFVDVDRSN